MSKNDFICQLLADLTKLHVERSDNSELSVLGAGFLAGLNTGMEKAKSNRNFNVTYYFITIPFKVSGAVVMNWLNCVESSALSCLAWLNTRRALQSCVSGNERSSDSVIGIIPKIWNNSI